MTALPHLNRNEVTQVYGLENCTKRMIVPAILRPNRQEQVHLSRTSNTNKHGVLWPRENVAPVKCFTSLASKQSKVALREGSPQGHLKDSLEKEISRTIGVIEDRPNLWILFEDKEPGRFGVTLIAWDLFVVI